MPEIREHLTRKCCVNQATCYNVDELSLSRLDPEGKIELDEQDALVPNSTLTSPKTKTELPTKPYVDSSDESRRNRRDLSPVYNDQDNQFDNNKLINLDGVTIKRNPGSDNEVSIKKYIDDSIKEATIVIFNKKLENYLKVSVGNDVYNLIKYDRIQITDTTLIKYPNTDGYFLQNWVLKCNDKNDSCEIQNLIKSTKTDSPTGYSGAESLPPIGNSFMYVETSSNNHGKNVFVTFERTDFIQIIIITFY